MDHRHCQDFTRAQALKRATSAVAGAGLPSIEPGMPAPAGTGLSRRGFMLNSAGVALSVYGASKLGLGAFEEGIAAAAESAPGQRVLVSVFLPGGIDSLSVLAPVGDPKYRTLRPRLALRAGTGQTFSEDSRLMWHPAAAGLQKLHAEGKVSVFPAIGYDHPDQSHFTSRHFWEVGELSASSQLGWLGRFLDVTGTMDNPLQGLSLNTHLGPALAAKNVPVAAVSRPQDYNFYAQGLYDPIAEPAMRAYAKLGELAANSDAMRQARTATRNAGLLRTAIAPFVPKDDKPAFTSPVNYPTAGGDFPQRLAALAAMLAAGLPIRAVSIEGVGGYDTHSDQATTLANNLKATVDAVLAFQRDLEARGLADRVLIQVWSEFGRRPKENGTGTDHGAGGVAFLIGTRARGQMVGEFPGLATLDADANLRSTSDFRAMYCSLLEQWFATDAGLVIPGASGFARPSLVKP